MKHNQHPMNIIVIGASGSIGSALVFELKKKGHRLYTVSRNSLDTDAQCDIRSAQSVSEMFQEIFESGFSPSCVVVASGIFEDDLIPEYNRALVEKNMAVNFFGVLNIIEAVLPRFLSSGTGQIIALSSIAAWRPNRRGIGYPASKAALSTAFRGLNNAYRQKGVAFSIVHLGPVETAMWEGGKSILVTSPETVARHISALITSRKPSLYTPFLSTSIARIARLIPDRTYMMLRRILLG